MRELRYAIRTLHNDLGFTTTAVITLAASIGINATAFSVVNAVLLRPLPFQVPDRLVTSVRIGGGSVATKTLL